jgi:hypothetical protein
MPVDPYIARGVAPLDVTNTLAQVSALRQRDQSLQLDQQRNALYGQNMLMERDKAAQAKQAQASILDLIEQAETAFEQGGFSAVRPLIGQIAAYDPSVAEQVAKSYEKDEMEYGQPVAGLDPQGRPTFARFSKSSPDPVFVPGLTPTPKDTQPQGSVKLSVNTAEDFYGNLAKNQAQAFTDLHGQASSAPDRIRRADSVLQLLDKNPYTGTGAEWKLAVGKAAKAAGFNYAGDDIANTETLGRELAGSTLEAIKSSGLGGGTGFSNADRDFLEKVTGGKITLDQKSLRRVAMLNKRSAENTINAYNTRAGKLKREQLDLMGLPQRIGGVDAGKPDQNGLVPGKKYTDADGNVATYMGNGKWSQ